MLVAGLVKPLNSLRQSTRNPVEHHSQAIFEIARRHARPIIYVIQDEVEKRIKCWSGSLLPGYRLNGIISGRHNDWCLWCVMRRTHYPNILDHSGVYLAEWVTQLWPRLFQQSYCGSQEDAHEFFLKLVGALKCVEKRNRGRAKSPSSPIDRIFGGQSRQEIICLCCGDASVKHEDFLYLSLALPRSGYQDRSPTVTQLLALNNEDEEIEHSCAK
ncbi:hypothetical protein KIN20_019725 [Parelaphostrongylus tenuis]|uniref:Ubiquitin carboxyl-terminal hydrolase 36 n=1 Tax=Parelaphostrongylus tenuis TaxID=148309 RepID=A0AAD5MRZ3_PARTN|nr:hypothetical protein KIN20_019725 [Parelaphostrongylus tenuis]